MQFAAFNSSTYADCAQYLKLHCKSDSEIVTEVLERERRELNALLVEHEGQPEVCFVNEAFVLLDERMAKLKVPSADKKAGEKNSTENKKYENQVKKKININHTSYLTLILNDFLKIRKFFSVLILLMFQS